MQHPPRQKTKSQPGIVVCNDTDTLFFSRPSFRSQLKWLTMPLPCLSPFLRWRNSSPTPPTTSWSWLCTTAALTNGLAIWKATRHTGASSQDWQPSSHHTTSYPTSGRIKLALFFIVAKSKAQNISVGMMKYHFNCSISTMQFLKLRLCILALTMGTLKTQRKVASLREACLRPHLTKNPTSWENSSTNRTETTKWLFAKANQKGSSFSTQKIWQTGLLSRTLL